MPKAPETTPVREPVPLLDPRMEFWDMVTVPEMDPPSRRNEPKLPVVSTQPVLFRVKLFARVTAVETQTCPPPVMLTAPLPRLAALLVLTRTSEMAVPPV